MFRLSSFVCWLGGSKACFVSMRRAIILLESNIGQSTLHQMLVHAGIRSKVRLLLQ